MTKEEKKKMCVGCYNDDYNRGLGGAKECWSLETAEPVMKKKVHMDDVPPWTQKPIKVLSCRREQRYIFVGPNQEC